MGGRPLELKTNITRRTEIWPNACSPLTPGIHPNRPGPNKHRNPRIRKIILHFREIPRSRPDQRGVLREPFHGTQGSDVI